MVLGDRIRESRKRAALTQAQVAEVMGVPRELVSMWESESRTPDLRKLEKLSHLYQVSVDYLLGEVELDERHERALLYRGLVVEPEVRVEIGRWLDFLDDWAELLEDLEEGEKLTGPNRPPRRLDKGQVTDSRRAATLAMEVREEYGLGRDAIPNLYAFLDSEGVLVCRAPLGPLDKTGISGAFLNHPKLGYCILVNADTSPGRQTFTLAHEFAHALYHYPSGGIVSQKAEHYDPKERFANTFAAHFLVPGKELRRMVEKRSREAVLDAYEALKLAAYFRVSYATLLNRLREEKLVHEEEYKWFKGHSPRMMALQVGLDPEDFELPKGENPYLGRYPISIIERVVRAVRDDDLTVPQAADLLNIDTYTLQQQIKAFDHPPKASEQEKHEFEELPF